MSPSVCVCGGAASSTPLSCPHYRVSPCLASHLRLFTSPPPFFSLRFSSFSRCTAMAGRPITTITTIMDFSGMGMGLLNPVAREYVAHAAAQDKEFYPEVLAKMFIINVPSFFSMAFGMVKPFLDERTVKKIEIISHKSDWLPRLAEHMGGLDRVPVEYGGTLVVEGGLYPPSRTKVEVLGAGKSFTRTVAVKAGQTVRFKWLCRPGDMRFGVTFHPHHGAERPPALPEGVAALKPLTPQGPAGGGAASSPSVVVYKLQDHPGSEKAFVSVSHSAAEDGTLVAVWSNEAGWRKRELFWRWDEVGKDGKPALPPRPLETLRPYGKAVEAAKGKEEGEGAANAAPAPAASSAAASEAPAPVAAAAAASLSEAPAPVAAAAAASEAPA